MTKTKKLIEENSLETPDPPIDLINSSNSNLVFEKVDSSTLKDKNSLQKAPNFVFTFNKEGGQSVSPTHQKKMMIQPFGENFPKTNLTSEESLSVGTGIYTNSIISLNNLPKVTNESLPFQTSSLINFSLKNTPKVANESMPFQTSSSSYKMPASQKKNKVEFSENCEVNESEFVKVNPCKVESVEKKSQGISSGGPSGNGNSEKNRVHYTNFKKNLKNLCIDTEVPIATKTSKKYPNVSSQKQAKQQFVDKEIKPNRLGQSQPQTQELPQTKLMQIKQNLVKKGYCELQSPIGEDPLVFPSTLKKGGQMTQTNNSQTKNIQFQDISSGGYPVSCKSAQDHTRKISSDTMGHEVFRDFQYSNEVVQCLNDEEFQLKEDLMNHMMEEQSYMSPIPCNYHNKKVKFVIGNRITGETPEHTQSKSIKNNMISQDNDDNDDENKTMVSIKQMSIDENEDPGTCESKSKKDDGDKNNIEYDEIECNNNDKTIELACSNAEPLYYYSTTLGNLGEFEASDKRMNVGGNYCTIDQKFLDNMNENNNSIINDGRYQMQRTNTERTLIELEQELRESCERPDNIRISTQDKKRIKELNASSLRKNTPNKQQRSRTQMPNFNVKNTDKILMIQEAHVGSELDLDGMSESQLKKGLNKANLPTLVSQGSKESENMWTQFDSTPSQANNNNLVSPKNQIAPYTGYKARFAHEIEIGIEDAKNPNSNIEDFYYEKFYWGNDNNSKDKSPDILPDKTVESKNDDSRSASLKEISLFNNHLKVNGYGKTENKKRLNRKGSNKLDNLDSSTWVNPSPKAQDNDSTIYIKPGESPRNQGQHRHKYHKSQNNSYNNIRFHFDSNYPNENDQSLQVKSFTKAKNAPNLNTSTTTLNCNYNVPYTKVDASVFADPNTTIIAGGNIHGVSRSRAESMFNESLMKLYEEYETECDKYRSYNILHKGDDDKSQSFSGEYNAWDATKDNQEDKVLRYSQDKVLDLDDKSESIDLVNQDKPPESPIRKKASPIISPSPGSHLLKGITEEDLMMPGSEQTLHANFNSNNTVHIKPNTNNSQDTSEIIARKEARLDSEETDLHIDDLEEINSNKKRQNNLVSSKKLVKNLYSKEKVAPYTAKSLKEKMPLSTSVFSPKHKNSEKLVGFTNLNIPNNMLFNNTSYANSIMFSSPVADISKQSNQQKMFVFENNNMNTMNSMSTIHWQPGQRGGFTPIDCEDIVKDLNLRFSIGTNSGFGSSKNTNTVSNAYRTDSLKLTPKQECDSHTLNVMEKQKFDGNTKKVSKNKKYDKHSLIMETHSEEIQTERETTVIENDEEIIKENCVENIDQKFEYLDKKYKQNSPYRNSLTNKEVTENNQQAQPRSSLGKYDPNEFVAFQKYFSNKKNKKKLHDTEMKDSPEEISSQIPKPKTDKKIPVNQLSNQPQPIGIITNSKGPEVDNVYSYYKGEIYKGVKKSSENRESHKVKFIVDENKRFIIEENTKQIQDQLNQIQLCQSEVIDTPKGDKIITLTRQTGLKSPQADQHRNINNKKRDKSAYNKAVKITQNLGGLSSIITNANSEYFEAEKEIPLQAGSNKKQVQGSTVTKTSGFVKKDSPMYNQIMQNINNNYDLTLIEKTKAFKNKNFITSNMNPTQNEFNKLSLNSNIPLKDSLQKIVNKESSSSFRQKGYDNASNLRMATFIDSGKANQLNIQHLKNSKSVNKFQATNFESPLNNKTANTKSVNNIHLKHLSPQISSRGISNETQENKRPKIKLKLCLGSRKVACKPKIIMEKQNINDLLLTSPRAGKCVNIYDRNILYQDLNNIRKDHTSIKSASTKRLVKYKSIMDCSTKNIKEILDTKPSVDTNKFAIGDFMLKSYDTENTPYDTNESLWDRKASLELGSKSKPNTKSTNLLMSSNQNHNDSSMKVKRYRKALNSQQKARMLESIL